MDKGKFKVIAEECRWKVRNFGENTVLEYEYDGPASWYDKGHEIKLIDYFLTIPGDSFYEAVQNEAEKFDVSDFAFGVSQQYFEKYGAVPPLVTICDAAKDVFTKLCRLRNLVKDNSAFNDFEQKIDAAASECGFSFYMDRAEECMTFKKGKVRFSADPDSLDEERMIRQVLDDLAEDVMFSEENSEKRVFGDELIVSISKKFNVPYLMGNAEKFSGVEI